MIGLERFVEGLKVYGFESVFSYDFMNSLYPGRTDSYSIFANRDKGMLLSLESNRGKTSVGPGTLYFEAEWVIEDDKKPLSEKEREIINTLMGFSNSPCYDKDGIHLARAVSLDVNRDLFGGLKRIETSQLELNNPWKFYDQHSLWLIDRSEIDDNSYEHRKLLTEGKIKKLPVDVRVMIGAG